MPIDVDARERLDRIAEATLRVAERDGPGAITIRAVSAELGGSTTMVTNYLKSRSDLLLNAVRYEQRSWNEDLTTAQTDAGSDPRARLDVLIRWSTSTLPHDKAARQIWMDLVSRAPETGASKLLREDAAEHHARFRALVAELGAGEDSPVADALYLAVRGFYFATTEDPDRWTSQRAADAIVAIAQGLLGR
ncbi:TetR/AcrR family transcriptional regulator [Streptomyces vietnamensis]|uniref:TetR/AcrR family transcriptional regulator n=1 Tax=Streptomyces vietnamensis TaxID=362257 RepID=UPI00342AA062